MKPAWLEKSGFSTPIPGISRAGEKFPEKLLADSSDKREIEGCEASWSRPGW